MEINTNIDTQDICEFVLKIEHIINLHSEGKEFLAGYELGQLKSLIDAFYAKVQIEKKKVHSLNERLI